MEAHSSLGTMMKATGLKRGSRKKQAPSSGEGGAPKEIRPPPPPEQLPPPPEIFSQNRRKPTADEAALTAKNYRLAKELSELRVRYREETKNVTRLTMENMNLASRCREAISHVAMLKQELAMHQKRAAEAIAWQREQTQRMAVNLSGEICKMSQSFSDEDEVEKSFESILKELGPPPPPPPPRPPRPESSKYPKASTPKGASSPKVEAFSDLEEDDTVEDTAHPRESLSPSERSDRIDPVPQTEEPPPQVFSTPNRNKSVGGWTPTIDNDPGRSSAVENTKMFPHSASPQAVLSKRHNYNEEFPADIIPQPHRSTPSKLTSSIPDQDDETASSSSPEPSSNSSPTSPETSSSPSLPRRDIINVNSIDTYESSFDPSTKFPPNFKPKDSNAEKERSPTTEIFNPFAPSPARSLQMIEIDPVGSPPSDSENSPFKRPNTPAIAENPEIVRKMIASDTSLFATTSPAPDRKNLGERPWKNDLQFHTPPKEKRNAGTSPVDEPSRPHKTVPAEARARYEKALQPRINGANSNQNAAGAQTAQDGFQEASNYQKTSAVVKGSPSALLKRIHQRRMNKQIHKQQSAPESLTVDSRELPAKRSDLNRQKSLPMEVMQNNERNPPVTVGSNTVMVVRETISTTSVKASTTIPKPEIAVRIESGEKPFDEVEEDPFSGLEGEPSYSADQTLQARLNAIKNRRSVKQPVSYAEPALNTKLRRGDTFFQKTELSPTLVTPEQLANVA